MITSFFKKSKSINFIIVFFIALLALLIGKLGVENLVLDVSFFVKLAVLFAVIFGSILLLNFIVNKNSLTQKDNYEMLLFSLFLLLITQSSQHSNVLFSNLFILLALRRLISLRTLKNTKEKLFDAAFWIGVAALFYFWSILFFALIILSLILLSDGSLRHWIIPFLGVLAVFILSIAVSVIYYDEYFRFIDQSFSVSFDYSIYNSLSYIIAITLLFSFGAWSSLFYLKNIKKKKKAFRASFVTIIFAAIIAFLIVLIAPNKNGGEFLFLFAPLAIIITNYIEVIHEKWFKEVFLGILIIAPFVLLLL
ncbi:hypothetical protein PW52_03825 [Tamlana sedimentorum]|uniref:Beta-carotene 15,15'-monooxygenase n=1 Tax=Neotamlana sedimentorum TaxID=1435349 RepID=A0A0D7WCI2_9FLAO|nr:DUF6427 family protein [Tamlana sedimentorum]KJD36774.1 hypothetical protein PW52_03825 [Tamlana sedimentorum]